MLCHELSHFSCREHTVFAERRIEEIPIDGCEFARFESGGLFCQLLTEGGEMLQRGVDRCGKGFFNMIDDPFCRVGGSAGGGNRDGKILFLNDGREGEGTEVLLIHRMDLRVGFSAGFEDACDRLGVHVGNDDEDGLQTRDQRSCVGAVASDNGDLLFQSELLDGGGDLFCGDGQSGTVGHELFDLFVSLVSAPEDQDRAVFNIERKR